MELISFGKRMCKLLANITIEVNLKVLHLQVVYAGVY